MPIMRQRGPAKGVTLLSEPLTEGAAFSCALGIWYSGILNIDPGDCSPCPLLSICIAFIYKSCS